MRPWIHLAIASSFALLSAHCAMDTTASPTGAARAELRGEPPAERPVRSVGRAAAANFAAPAPRGSTCVAQCGRAVVCTCDDDLAGDGVLERSDDGGATWRDVQIFPRPSFVRPFFEDAVYEGASVKYRICARSEAGESCDAVIDVASDPTSCSDGTGHDNPADAPHHGAS